MSLFLSLFSFDLSNECFSVPLLHPSEPLRVCVLRDLTPPVTLDTAEHLFPGTHGTLYPAVVVKYYLFLSEPLGQSKFFTL